MSDECVTVTVNHPSFVAGSDFADGIGYLEPKDRVAVWWHAEGSIPDPITDVMVVETDGQTVTLRFASQQDASRFAQWLKKGVRLLVPLQHREGLVLEFTQGIARGESHEDRQ